MVIKEEKMNNSRKYLIMYLAISFGVCWGIGILYIFFGDFLVPITGELTLTHPIAIIALYSPTIAGLITYFVMGGVGAVKGILLKVIPRRQDLVWFPIMFGLVLLLWINIRYISSPLFGIESREITYRFPEMISTALWLVIKETGLIGGLFGWIGFLLPFLQSKFKNNIYSGLLTGLLFGLWVLPGYVISSFQIDQSYLLYVVLLMVFISFMSYIFNATKGNLLIYTFTFWLVATGSHIQLYYFTPPVQAMQISFFLVAWIVTHVVFKKMKIDQTLQVFPEFIQIKTGTKETVNHYVSRA
jgi:membrane protease YdiL (CAAX protease family)